jgi:3-oxoacyl-[acyl-carrier-protein] synthase-3
MKIVSTGLYVPPKVQTAAELAPLIGRSEKWIIEKTGVRHRHIAEEPLEGMAAKAACEALNGGGKPDLILNASAVPLQAVPDNSVFIQNALGFKGIPCHSIHATCLSFLVAVKTANAFIVSGMYRRILIVSSEMGSIGRNFKEPPSAALVGDGAAAAVVEPAPDGEPSAMIAWSMSTWPEGAHLTEFRGWGVRRHPHDPNTKREDHFFHGAGPAVYKLARRRIGPMLRDLFRQAGLNRKDIDLVVPHQASGPALDAAPHYGGRKEQVVNIVGEYGNCVAASMPMALAIAHREGRMSRGDRVMLVGAGAGLSVAGAILRW